MNTNNWIKLSFTDKNHWLNVFFVKTEVGLEWTGFTKPLCPAVETTLSAAMLVPGKLIIIQHTVQMQVFIWPELAENFVKCCSAYCADSSFAEANISLVSQWWHTYSQNNPFLSKQIIEILNPKCTQMLAFFVLSTCMYLYKMRIVIRIRYFPPNPV